MHEADATAGEPGVSAPADSDSPAPKSSAASRAASSAARAEPAEQPGAAAVGDADAPDLAEARIGGRLNALDDLGRRPLAEHAPIYEQLHDELQAELAEIDST